MSAIAIEAYRRAADLQRGDLIRLHETGFDLWTVLHSRPSLQYGSYVVLTLSDGAGNGRNQLVATHRHFDAMYVCPCHRSEHHLEPYKTTADA